MLYKSNNIEFLSDDMGISNLFFYRGYYYFETGVKLKQAEIVSEEEFAEAVNSVAHVPIEPVEPEPTQLDRIEAAVNGIAENSTSYAEMAAAITEGVNEV